MAIGLLGMASSIGLLDMREWALKATIFLATFPVSVCVLLLILRPKTLFLPDPGQGAMLAFGGPQQRSVSAHPKVISATMK
jgi:hypothetical protein